ncbi:hypothetical protein PPL_08104 [Heterostelium album PN500]|uniref:B box-type domain-containing protein n=1 Tax=Heterostelium pallidum (strain ATCC 26659 / Pp 5 / PN500) TaxID=670386 RepID=D3BIM5_HETP5|nr:hypothetical protein PPL_08104 [Heterostelium album PN500]EFA78649.1 hypothetical protein PPL_08104 [Heterostelium album PN500]|eukprot:XP_020430773.1 hypothetical protein PPL_08104 [Heterostelium album PN500]
MTVKCAQHQRSHDLMCPKCIIIHNRANQDHLDYHDHIDSIRQSLSHNLLDVVSDSNSDHNIKDQSGDQSDDIDDSTIISNTVFREKITSLWSTLKSSSDKYQSLTTTENEIKQHFEQLHQYLIVEEHKLKKDIINNKDAIINLVDNNMNQLKYLVNIININSKLDNDNDNNTVDQHINSDSSNNNQDQSVIADTTDQYSTIAIMKSITCSSSLKSFVKDNSQSLFSHDQNQLNIGELLTQHNNDQNSIILDIINKYNIHLTTDSNNNLSDCNNDTDYKVSIKQPDFNQLNSIIQQSIILTATSPQSTASTSTNKSSFILATHQSNGATLINTSNNTTEELQFSYDFFQTSSSMVSVGEYVYIFGGVPYRNKWFRFSLKSKSIDHVGDMDNYFADCFISVCYDGQDLIYLVNGSMMNRIDYFNVRTFQFDRLYMPKEILGQQLSSMFYKGKLYSVPLLKKVIAEFDLTSNQLMLKHPIVSCPMSACHDDNGNFFIHGSDGSLVKFNVETKQTTKLNVKTGKADSVYLLYHRVSAAESFVYSFGGVDYGNFKYSIEQQQQQPYLIGDKHVRAMYGSVSF